MDLEKQPAPPARSPEGCLTVAIRIPVRIVVLVLVVPVRVAWDALVVIGRFLRDSVLRPLWRALVVWPCAALWRYVVVPLAKAIGWLGKVLVLAPLVWLYRYVLMPVGHGLVWTVRGIGAGLAWAVRGVGAGAGWLYARVLTPLGHGIVWLLKGTGAVLAWIFTPVWRAVVWCAGGLAWLVGMMVRGVGVALYWVARILLVLPAVALWRWVLTPVWRAVVWCAGGLAWLVGMMVRGVGVALYWVARILLVLPAVALWRWVLAPVGRVLVVVGREVWGALGHAWRIAGYISLAVGRFLGTLFRWIFVEPVRWVYLTVLTPVGHMVRDLVLRPVAEAARSVGRISRAAIASARETVRQTRADIRRMLFGETREREAVARREPTGADTRTLGSSTTALTKD
ncbi:hypothetical protein [Streptomyces sp. NPDC005374]|uniref:hypothetical protein n=1 Tax=Streptomyces sp. NPDC005374 TaxID=3364713 RepID=UPI00369C9B92